ncbi:GNAT family N-acetyltransferase [Bacteroides ihuae]|uniref:GNAT family N-acetyltransferase n=1 Tax=Bacteroides ihuae TaxID=1852362 RepID=UPI0008D9A050|nr:GNAT family N-acetyltransferase [Bacteroides ihuae]
MIEIARIKTTDVEKYNYMENLLVESFPREEYRELDELRKYTDNYSNFHNNIIINERISIGLITFWNFGNFSYIEHFAIDPQQRNGGYGKKVLSHLCTQLNCPIVLEVEQPITEIAKRRINFYEKIKFTIWDREYYQPAYRIEDSSIPMYLMEYGNLDGEIDPIEVRKIIHHQVYGIK